MDDINGFEAVIGLEVHAQLLTRTKIFCGCPSRFGAEPNTLVCPVCLGLPGALPVLNSRAVSMALQVSMALGCSIAETGIFARKNYFYPDCPKNYQISMYEQPLCTGGFLETGKGSEVSRVGIERIHLEEDAGKLIHGPDGESFVDFNRSGVPLIEIVTLPEISSAKQAVDFLKRLRQVLRYLEVCDGNLEEGSMRCDVNVSLRRRGDENLGVKTEIKNLNSFRAVESGIDFEIKRQAGILSSGRDVYKVTNLWDASSRKLVEMRSKEEADDYRYFPDPDLLRLEVSADMVSEAAEAMPELPAARRSRFIDEYSLSPYEAGVMTAERQLADYFEEVAAGSGNPSSSCKWVMRDVLAAVKETGSGIDTFPVRAQRLAELIRLVDSNVVHATGARTVFSEMVRTGRAPEELIEELRLAPISSEDKLEDLAESVLASNPEEVKRYHEGENRLLGFFMGELMKQSGGRADPVLANRILKEKLERR